MTRAKNRSRTRLVCAVALGLSLVAGGIAGATEAEPSASFASFRSHVEARVAADGRLGLQAIPGLESNGALQDLEIWPASLVVDTEVPRLEVSGPLTVGNQTTEARFEGRQMPDGSVRFSIEFEYLSLADVTGLMERQTGGSLPADAPVRSDLELTEVKVVLEPGHDDAFTVKGTATVAGLTLDVLAGIARRSDGENGDLSEMIVGIRTTELSLTELGGALAGTALDVRLGDVVFAIRQPFHTAALAPVALSELDPVAEEYFRIVVGQDEEFELRLAAGFNLFAGIDVALLPAPVIQATGLDPNERILLQGPIGLDLRKLVDLGSLQVESMRLTAELPEGVPPSLADRFTETARVQRSLVLEFVRPLVSLKLIERGVEWDGTGRFEIFTDFSSDGEPVRTGTTGPETPADWEPESPLAKVVAAAGFLYDPAQDVIYSRSDAWQRSFGYAPLYDTLAPLTISAIIDCERIFFEYGGKEWMVELWKGQYGLETGGEIGVYNRGTNPQDKAKYAILDKITGKFFDAVGDDELWDLSFVLNKRPPCPAGATACDTAGKPLFRRGPENHWWLTGFKWGVLSDPEELTMDMTIDFDRIQDPGLLEAFVGGLRSTGYEKIEVDGNTVRFVFDQPFTAQPITRTKCKKVVQRINKALVDLYNGLGLESNDPNLILKEALDGIAAQKAYRLVTEHFETIVPGWGLDGEIATRVLARLAERRELFMQNLREIRDRKEARRQAARDAFQSALDLLKEPARTSMDFFKRRYDEAVSKRDHSYAMWQVVRPIHRPAWRASYVYWKGIAGSRLVAYNVAAAVYHADVETWVAQNPLLSTLRQARENAWQAVEQANASLDQANRMFSQLVSQAETVHRTVSDASLVGPRP